VVEVDNGGLGTSVDTGQGPEPTNRVVYAELPFHEHAATLCVA
jgi:hypothetical protein